MSDQNMHSPGIFAEGATSEIGTGGAHASSSNTTGKGPSRLCTGKRMAITAVAAVVVCALCGLSSFAGTTAAMGGIDASQPIQKSMSLDDQRSYGDKGQDGLGRGSGPDGSFGMGGKGSGSNGSSDRFGSDDGSGQPSERSNGANGAPSDSGDGADSSSGRQGERSGSSPSAAGQLA